MRRRLITVVASVMASIAILATPAHNQVVATAFDASMATDPSVSQGIPGPTGARTLADLPPTCSREAHAANITACIVKKNAPFGRLVTVSFAQSHDGIVVSDRLIRTGVGGPQLQSPNGIYKVWKHVEHYVTVGTINPKTGKGYPMEQAVFVSVFRNKKPLTPGVAVHFSHNFQTALVDYQTALANHQKDPAHYPAPSMDSSWGCFNEDDEENAKWFFKVVPDGATVNVVSG